MAHGNRKQPCANATRKRAVSPKVRRPGGRHALTDVEMGDPNHSYNYAVSLLARRDYSANELRRKLKARGYIEIAVEPVIFDLECAHKLNDRRYGSNVVAYRSRRGQGPARIRNELRKAGVGADIVEAVVKGDVDVPDFLSLARAVRIRKFGPDLPTDRKERARQARFLQYRGFSTDHIRAVLEGVPDDESDLDPAGEPDPT